MTHADLNKRMEKVLETYRTLPDDIDKKEKFISWFFGYIGGLSEHEIISDIQAGYFGEAIHDFADSHDFKYIETEEEKQEREDILEEDLKESCKNYEPDPEEL